MDGSPPPAAQPCAKTNVPGVRKDCLFPISPPPDPNFPRVIGLSEGGREAGQHCVSIVNREIQLELHGRRSWGLSREAVFSLNFSTSSFPEPCPHPYSPVSPSPTPGPQIALSLAPVSGEFSQETGGGGVPSG